MSIHYIINILGNSVERRRDLLLSWRFQSLITSMVWGVYKYTPNVRLLTPLLKILDICGVWGEGGYRKAGKRGHLISFMIQEVYLHSTSIIHTKFQPSTSIVKDLGISSWRLFDIDDFSTFFENQNSQKFNFT